MLLLVLLAFVLISSACFGILTLFIRGGRNRSDDVPAPGGRRGLVFGPLTPALAGVLPAGTQFRAECTRFLRQAGHYHAQALAEFLSLRNALVVGAVLWIATTIVVVTEPGDALTVPLVIGGAIVVALLYAVPRLVLESMAKARTRRIEESLPDAMDMISMCVSAGLPLPHAISRVSEELQSSHPDLAFELRIVGRQTEAGSLTSSIQHFAKRLDIPEIHSVAAMVYQAEHQGASVAGAFQAFSDQVRLHRRQRAEEAGNKQAFKMLFPIVFCLAPAVFLVLLGPAVMEMREFLRRERQPGGALSLDNFQTLANQPVNPTTGLPAATPGGAGVATRGAAGVATPGGAGPGTAPVLPGQNAPGPGTTPASQPGNAP